MRLRQFGIGGLVGLFLATAGGAAFSQNAANSATTASQTYVLGPADVIEVSVLGRTDYTTKGRIEADGTFRVPFLGSIVAANKSPTKLADELAKALDAGGYFNHPVVNVAVQSFASRYVTVLGAVTHPDLVPVDRAYRLSEIMAKVGGAREGGADYVIYTPNGGTPRHIGVMDMGAGDPKDDPYVAAGDKVYVPEADLFYISGQVRSGGAFPIKPNLTFRMAIARAGGLTESGSDKALTLTRGGKKIRHVNLDDIVQPGDNLLIGERLF